MQNDKQQITPKALPPEGLVDIHEVAAAMKMSAGSVRNRIKDGSFPAPRKIGRLARWDVSTVRKFLAA